MTPEEYTNRFERVIKDIKVHNDGQIMTRVAIEALTLLKKRVQETGTNAKGQEFKAYSTKPMLIGCSSFRKDVCNQLFGSKEKRAKMDWRTVGGSGGYAAYLSVSSGASGGANSGKGRRLAILPGGYKEWRRLMGRPTDKVDFTVSGRMWNNVTVISSTSDHKNGMAIIGAKEDTEKKKLAGNTKRKGDILDLSQKEQDILKEDFNLEVLQVFRENGL